MDDRICNLVEAALGAAYILESLAEDGIEGDALRLVASVLEERALAIEGDPCGETGV